MAGCGSSDSSDTTTTQPTSQTLIGTFIDAPVAWVEYTTSSGITGITGTQGEFSYESGDSVTLSIGNLTLGVSAPAEDGLVTPENLVDTQEKVTLMLQTLQSLDSDGDPTNGITITAEDRAALKEIQEEKFANLNENDLMNIEQIHACIDKNNDGHIDVPANEAQAHFEHAKEQWREQHTTQNQGDANTTQAPHNDTDHAKTPHVTNTTEETTETDNN
jgi:hypothetical protein